MSSTAISTGSKLFLQTKFYRPRTAGDLIIRPHLLDRLNQHFPRKLTLISAPAGYGKTTMATEWLAQLAETQQQAALPVAWLSLDEYDDDLLFFLRYLVSAAQTVYPDFGVNTLAAIQSAQPPPGQQLAIILANDFAQLAKPLILTLDDYHFITQETIHQLVNRLLDHLPPSLHLVLLSRTEPLLALERLRASRQIIELHATDLSFSLAETTQFVSQALGKDPQPETLQAIHSGSEGWIAGLQLATLSLPHQTHNTQQTDEAALLQHFQGNHHYLINYLFEEVLVLQPQAVQDFLLQTSILDRFCAPLCETVLGTAWLNQVAQDEQLSETITLSQTQAQMILAWLHRANLFLIPLDHERVWYRYHHLFQKMLAQTLAQRMNRTDIAALHRQASMWLANKGLVEPALHQALAADDMPMAIQLIEQHRLTLLDQFDFYTLERWLALLPKTVTEQRPALLLLRGWIDSSTYRMASIPVIELAQQAEACLENPNIAIDRPDRHAQNFEIAALRAMGWFWYGDFQKVLHYALEVIEELPLSPAYIRTTVVSAAAFALQATGQPAKATELIEQELNNEDVRLSLPGIQLAAWLPLLHCMAGHLQQAIQVAQNIMNLIQVRADNDTFVKTTLYRWLGYIYYQWNDLAAAREYLVKVDQAHTAPFHNSQLNLAWIYEIQGQTQIAQQIITQRQHNAFATNNKLHLNEIASFQARCLHWQGEIDLAAQQFHGVSLQVEKERWLACEVPLFTQARILIAQNKEDCWQKAEGLLQDGYSQSEKAQNIPHQIEVLALQSLLCQKRGKLDVALSVLTRSIQLAKPGGFIRIFVDLGTPIAQLLRQLLARGFEPKYLGRILAAFPTTQLPSQAALSTQPVQPPPQSLALVEPLTDRELEVLTLLAERLSNKEIAKALAISPFTVKNHLSTIYRKVGAYGRHQTVRQAKQLGLLH